MELQLLVDQAEGEVDRLKREIKSVEMRGRDHLENSNKMVESERAKGEERVLALQERVKSLEGKLQESTLRETTLLSQKSGLEKRAERESGLLLADKNRLEREKDVLHGQSFSVHSHAFFSRTFRAATIRQTQ